MLQYVPNRLSQATGNLPQPLEIEPSFSFLWHIMEICIPMWLEVWFPAFVQFTEKLLILLLKSGYGRMEESFMFTLCHLCIWGEALLRKGAKLSSGKACEAWGRANVNPWPLLEKTGNIPWVTVLLDQEAHPKISKSHPQEMRTDNEGCSWAHGECTAGEAETAAEMHRDRDTKCQSQAEETQKMRRKWEFVCTHLTQTATEVFDWKLSLKKGTLSGIYRKQDEIDLGIIYCIYPGKKKRDLFWLKKEKKKEKGRESTVSSGL